MGVVLLARDPNSGRNIAIKMIKPDLVANQQVVHRFVKEAGHLQRMRHANVMPVLEVYSTVPKVRTLSCPISRGKAWQSESSQVAR